MRQASSSAIEWLVPVGVLLCCAPAWGATQYYVDNAVGASGNGQSWATAWKSFSDIAWGSVQPGDTIYVSGGSTSKVYTEALVVGASGSAGSYVTVARGVDTGHDGRVIIDGNNGALDQGILISGVDHVYVKGFEIRQTQIGAWVQCDAGNVNDAVVDSLTIYEYYNQAGVAINGHCGGPTLTNIQNVVVKNCTITATFPDFDGQTDNIYAQVATNLTIENNTLVQHNKHVQGSIDNLQFYTVGNAVVRNNFMVQDGTHGDQCMILGVTGDQHTLKVYNNVAVHYGGGSVLIIRSYDATEPAVFVHHNTLIAAPQEPLYIWTASLEKPAVMHNNILAHFGVSGASSGSLGNFTGLPVTNILNNLFYVENGGIEEPPGFSGTWYGTGGQTLNGIYWDDWVAIGGNGYRSNPNFVDFANQDFKVKLPSDAVDNGVALDPEFATDIDGVARPYGAGWDVGAHEYTPPCVLGSDCVTPPVCRTAQGATCVDSQCVYPLASAGTTCDDGNVCTGGDVCDGAGACGAGPNVCGDGGAPPPDGGIPDGGIPDGGVGGQGPVLTGAGCGCVVSSRSLQSSHWLAVGLAALLAVLVLMRARRRCRSAAR